MKTTAITFLIGCLFSATVYGQSARYPVEMEKNKTTLFNATNKETYLQVANAFERIGNAEKTEWLPYYYGAYALVMQAYMDQDVSKLDAIMDKADELINKAESLEQNHSEITNIKAMIMVIRMQVDNSRGMTLGPKSSAMLEKAMAQKPLGNPRVMMNLAQNLFYTPEAFGGSKRKGIEMMEKALAAYETFKPESTLHPNWGKAYVEKTLSQWKGDK
jgi:hypothetical protein